ncbi:MAG: YeeE/YedE thiosulfate transporter family protein [Corynebacterium sp.]|nr:YeeE/YedE thiosulfate transporter family protein [Corynebacterium sp.]
MVTTGLILGGALGYVMQRGRFCVTGFLRDIFTQRSYRGLVALFIVIAVHAVGLGLLTTSGVISPSPDNFAPLAVIVGGFVFGMGIILAGGCASGTWYRSGEGLIGSWIALVMYALSAAAMKTGILSGLNDALGDITINATSMPETLGVSIWFFITPFAAAVAWLTWTFLKAEFSNPQPVQLTPRKTGLAHILTEKSWHVYSTAAIVGLLGVIAWPLSAATGRNSGLGITTPSANLANGIVTGDTERFDWGVMLVLGILVGSYIAAKLSGEFRLRVPDARQGARSVVGGVMMGVGAAWAGGCTVGNGMVETSLFTYQGWVALAFMTLGVGAGAKLWLKPTPVVNENAKDSVQPAGTSQSAVYDASTVAIAPQASAQSANTSLGFAVAPVGLLEHVHDGKGELLTNLGNGRWAMDTLGAVCPFPLIEAKQAIQQIPVGDELVITFDCTQATDAIPRWAARDGHTITQFEQVGQADWIIAVQRGH